MVAVVVVVVMGCVDGDWHHWLQFMVVISLM